MMFPFDMENRAAANLFHWQWLDFNFCQNRYDALPSGRKTIRGATAFAAAHRL
jgi:hypothetical protein